MVLTFLETIAKVLNECNKQISNTNVGLLIKLVKKFPEIKDKLANTTAYLLGFEF